MTDSTLIASDSLSLHTLAADTAVVQSSVLIDILAVLSAVLCILFVRKFIDIIPYMLGSLFRWKEAANLENSMRISRNRDVITFLFFLPFCIAAARYRLWPGLADCGLSENGIFLTTCGIFIAYIIIRGICCIAGRLIKGNQKTLKMAIRVSRTFFCTVTVMIIGTGAVLSLSGVAEDTIRTVLLYETATVYLLFILRKSQIFINSCSLFSTILYLCTLEILPTGILIATAVLV